MSSIFMLRKVCTTLNTVVAYRPGPFIPEVWQAEGLIPKDVVNPWTIPSTRSTQHLMSSKSSIMSGGKSTIAYPSPPVSPAPWTGNFLDMSDKDDDSFYVPPRPSHHHPAPSVVSLIG